MLLDKLKDIPVILGSQSPRRQELLTAMDIDFTVEIKNVDESFDRSMPTADVAEWIAQRKLSAFAEAKYQDTIVVTSDTVVVDREGTVLGKPTDAEEAIQVLQSLSGQKHIVYTGVAIGYKRQIWSFTSATHVEFHTLDAEEITYYTANYAPLDKAGSYGIQEWIGRIGVKSIQGTYENVMGLPTAELFQQLKAVVSY